MNGQVTAMAAVALNDWWRRLSESLYLRKRPPAPLVIFRFSVILRGFPA
jgi:hypothetical protein